MNGPEFIAVLSQVHHWISMPWLCKFGLDPFATLAQDDEFGLVAACDQNVDTGRISPLQHVVPTTIQANRCAFEATRSYGIAWQ